MDLLGRKAKRTLEGLRAAFSYETSVNSGLHKECARLENRASLLNATCDELQSQIRVLKKALFNSGFAIGFIFIVFVLPRFFSED